MRKLAASASAALIITAGPLMVGAAPAQAATGSPQVADGTAVATQTAEIGVCVPTAAWTETAVVTPAVPAVPGIPAVPEIPEISHMETVVIREAWTETVVDKEAWDEVVVDKEAWDEVVVDKEAWDEEVFDHWQHYSWTGGPHLSDDPPAFPGAGWQPNTQGDPHGVGHEGAYFRSHGGAGNGDWFYLEAVTRTVHHPAETHTVHHPAETHTVHHPAETHTVEHPAVTEEVKVIDQEYVPGVPAVPGTPAIPAVTMEIEHPAVECPAPAAAEAAQPTELAKTGGSTQLPILFAGAGAIGLGLTAVGVRHLARK